MPPMRHTPVSSSSVLHMKNAASSHKAWMLGLLMSGFVSAVAMPAHAAFWDGLMGSDTQEEQAKLGPKRVPAGNAGERTRGDALLLEPAATPSYAAAPVSSPSANMAPEASSPSVDIYSAASAAMPGVADPSAPAPMLNNGMGSNGQAMPYGTNMAAPPLAPVRASAPVETSAKKKPTSVLGWLGLSEEEQATQAAAPAPQPSATYQPEAPTASPYANSDDGVMYMPDNGMAAAATVPNPVAPSADQVEYYDANGFPILAATPNNPPAPNRAEQAQETQKLQAANQAGESMRATFMEKGEQAFAPTPQADAAPAPAMDNMPAAPASVQEELALGNAAAPAPTPGKAPNNDYEGSAAMAQPVMAEAAPTPVELPAVAETRAPVNQNTGSSISTVHAGTAPRVVTYNEMPGTQANAAYLPAIEEPGVPTAQPQPPMVASVQPAPVAAMPAPVAEENAVIYNPVPTAQAPVMQTSSLPSTQVPVSASVSELAPDAPEYAQGLMGTNPTLNPSNVQALPSAAAGSKPTVRYLPESRYATRRAH